MALWTGLGQAATVAQLVGADVGGLISMIVQAAMTACQNKSECEQLAGRVLMIAQLLPHVQEPEAAAPLAGLGDTLRDAHELVVSCQGRSAAYQFVMAGRQAKSFREVQSKIDSYLILFPVISHIGITRRLERINNVLVPDDSTRIEPSPLPQLQEFTEVAQEVLPHGTQEFDRVLVPTEECRTKTVRTRAGVGVHKEKGFMDFTLSEWYLKLKQLRYIIWEERREVEVPLIIFGYSNEFLDILLELLLFVYEESLLSHCPTT